MESPRTKHRLTSIFLVILISMLLSCSKETKKEPQKIYDIPENMQSAEHSGNHDTNHKSEGIHSSTNSSNAKSNQNLIISGNNVSSFRLDDQIINPEKTEGYIKNEGDSKKINIASYTGSEGYFFSLYVPKGKNIVGSHDLNKNGNQLILNHKENGLLTVYGSHFCEDNAGQIMIEAYDKSKNIISGSFSTVVCNKGVIGKRGNKTIQMCEFKDVKLLAL